MVHYVPNFVYTPGSEFDGAAPNKDYVSVTGLAYVSLAGIQDILDLFPFAITRRRNPLTMPRAQREGWTSLILRGPFKTLHTVDDEPYNRIYRRHPIGGGKMAIFLDTVEKHFAREHRLPRNPKLPLVTDASGSIYAAEDLWIQFPAGSKYSVLDPVFDKVCTHIANKERQASLAVARQQQDSNAQIADGGDEDEDEKPANKELVEDNEIDEDTEMKEAEGTVEEHN